MRRRLLIAIGAVAILAVLAFAAPLGIVLGHSYRDQGLLRLQRDTVAISRAVDVSGQAGDEIEIPRSSDLLGVYDLRGRRLAGRGPARVDSIAAQALRSGRPVDATDGGSGLVVAVPLRSGERTVGVLRAQRASVGGAGRGWLVIAGVAAIVIAAALGAALLLSRRIARPLEDVADAATRLGEGDFGVRSSRTGVREIDAVAEALDRTAQRLGDLVTRERTFSADASHQLRTPLQAVRLELEALQLRGGDAPELTAALGQVDRLHETIETLLSVARDTQRSGQRCDLVVLADESASRWRRSLAAAGRPLVVDDQTGGHAVANVSGAVVREVLDVLLSNAEGHGAGEVRVSIRASDRWLLLDVADEGEGFTGGPASHFERRAAAAGGTGIGMALARSLADAEGGRLTIVEAGPRPVVRLTAPAAAVGD